MPQSRLTNRLIAGKENAKRFYQTGFTEKRTMIGDMGTPAMMKADSSVRFEIPV
jgi:hypothetical protein